MNPFIVALLFILGLALALGLLVGGTFVTVWNINDIAANGANFWNVFWILLVASALFGGASKAAS